MRTTTELIIRGERAQLERLLARVEELLRNGWKRNREAEERLDEHGIRGPWDRCFSCTATANRPAAAFWAHARTTNELYVANVIPLEKQRLTEEEGNRLLVEIEREIFGPAAAALGVKTEVIQRRLTLEDDLSPEAVRLLRAFSASANRQSLRPNDRSRWNAFPVRMHRDESLVSAGALDEWLKEEGWPDETRRQLVNEYEAARSLLIAYDEEAASR
jgi:hypothetical protein